MKVQRHIDELLTLRASEWFEILKDPTDTQRAEFVSWLSESKLHLQEFLEVATVDAAVGGMDPKLRGDLDALLSQITPSGVSSVSVLQRPRAQPLGSTWRRSRTIWRPAAWAASGAALALVIVMLRPLLAPHEFSTAIGEQKAITLADASVVTLDANSLIHVHLQDAEREIELRQGEAIFKVARDNKRPFRVHTRAGVIQAIGTQFNVYARADGNTTVSVLEGRVQVSATATSTALPETQVLSAGEEADIRLDGAIQRNPKAVVSNTVAWRERRLVFSKAPLEEMVQEFNRYNRSPRFTLQDVPANTYRFAGIFDADDPQSLADLLTREPDLLVERHADEIVIRKR